jgi:hypothetical protein
MREAQEFDMVRSVAVVTATGIDRFLKVLAQYLTSGSHEIAPS